MSQRENVWRKRPTVSLTCPSGQVVTVRRPSPSVMLKAGKVQRIFQKQKPEDTNNIDKQLEFLETLPDDELTAVWNFARVLVCDAALQPLLFLQPKEGQLTPDDIPIMDFWFIFTWIQNGGIGLPVKLTEGETDIEAVQTFPGGQDAGDNAGEDSPAM